jgi:hypothetical protein
LLDLAERPWGMLVIQGRDDELADSMELLLGNPTTRQA